MLFRTRPLAGYGQTKAIKRKNHTTHHLTSKRAQLFNYRIGKSYGGYMKSDKIFKSLLTEIGESLAELRIKKGYSTIKAFAERYDLPEIQYWRIERGKANITLKSLSRILNIHRLSIHDFFCYMQSERAAA